MMDREEDGTKSGPMNVDPNVGAFCRATGLTGSRAGLMIPVVLHMCYYTCVFIRVLLHVCITHVITPIRP